MSRGRGSAGVGRQPPKQQGLGLSRLRARAQEQVKVKGSRGRDGGVASPVQGSAGDTRQWPESAGARPRGRAVMRGDQHEVVRARPRGPNRKDGEVEHEEAEPRR